MHAAVYHHKLISAALDVCVYTVGNENRVAKSVNNIASFCINNSKKKAGSKLDLNIC